MYIIRSTLSLYQWGKEQIPHKYMSMQEYMSLIGTYLTKEIQTGFCPHKVEILLEQQLCTYIHLQTKVVITQYIFTCLI